MELDPPEAKFVTASALQDSFHDSSSELTFCDPSELEAELDAAVQNACDAMRQKAFKVQVIA